MPTANIQILKPSRLSRFIAQAGQASVGFLRSLNNSVRQIMKRIIVISAGCLVFMASCARVDIPQFTSVECSADPVYPAVTDTRKIEELSEILRTLPGSWRPVPDMPVKIGLAVVLKRDLHAVAQVVIGEDWLSIQAADDRGPLMHSRAQEKSITSTERDRIIRLAREMPKPLQPTRPSGPRG